MERKEVNVVKNLVKMGLITNTYRGYFASKNSYQHTINCVKRLDIRYYSNQKNSIHPGGG